MTLEFKPSELKKYDGSDSNVPIYVAIKGRVFDVSISRETYTPPKGYSVFAGRDASRALGKSSMKEEDCISDWSGLTDEEKDVLDKWVIFFEKKYPVIGVMVAE